MPKPDPKRIAEFIEPLRVEPGRKVRLPDDFDPAFSHHLQKDDADDVLERGIELLAEYQERLYAANTAGLLVIIQAMDAAGKDGTIGHVMSGVNPQGVQVSSFKVPSTEEMDHDFLWRYAKRLPERGNIGIFNRSYYEETLVVRVHPAILDGQKIPDRLKGKTIWDRRFKHINNWEAYLVDQGFSIVKLFLNVSKEEQRLRFLARIDEPEKNWKFAARRQGAWLLGRLPGGVQRGAHQDEHQGRPVVRDPGRQEVVRAGGSRRHRGCPDPARPAVSRRRRGGEGSAPGSPGRARRRTDPPRRCPRTGAGKAGKGAKRNGRKGRAQRRKGAPSGTPRLHPGEDLRLLRLELLGRDHALVSNSASLIEPLGLVLCVGGRRDRSDGCAGARAGATGAGAGRGAGRAAASCRA